MKKGHESKVVLKDMVIYHQNLPKKQLKLHSHPEAHLFIPIRGEIKISHDQRTINIPPGKMYFVAAHCKHSFESSHLQGERIILLLNSKYKENKILPANSLLKELLFYILVENDSISRTRSQVLVKSLLNELLEKVSFDVSQLHSRAKDERVLKAIEIIDSKLDLSISEVASLVGSTTKTLTRLFSHDLNLTPKQVQTALRIDRAQTLLKRGEMNVTEVAYEVGFNSLSSFIKNYRLITGSLPSEAKL